MFGVSHKHRYFRIQVVVSVCISMVAYFAIKAGLLQATENSSSAQMLGMPLFTVGPILAACVLVYFRHGELRFNSVFLTSLFLYFVVFGWPFIFTSPVFGAHVYSQKVNYLVTVNFMGYLILAGFTAWLGKLVGILTLLSLGLCIYSETNELLLFAPALAALNITNVYLQWMIAIVISVSSFLADR